MLFVNLATKSPPHHSFRKSLLPTLLLPPVECKQNKIKQLAKFKTHKKWKLFWVIVLWIINEISVTLVMWEPYHKNDWEEDTRHKHDWKTVNEPWAPVDTISKPHHSHGFLEPEIWTLKTPHFAEAVSIKNYTRSGFIKNLPIQKWEAKLRQLNWDVV